ncbi:MAG: MoxR family ATPase [Candidatus Margulisbacteria bacterium]|nr:MoxR family ATPase [Candidatus Margulisiibacteriota bacterium]
MSDELEKINLLVEKESAFIEKLLSEVGKVIVGQNYVLERLLIGILTNGHILLEGVPGLAKTLAVKTLSNAVHAKFSRIQFTPDLLPADLIGTLIYNQSEQSFIPKLGPIFANFILADEINRAPAKVQSALLEAMQERQVTIGNDTYKLEEPFLVLATQNPIEQEGTYPLPEAQLDRFIMKLKVMYPKKSEEKEIINRMTSNEKIEVTQIVSPKDIMRAREVVNQIYVDDKIKDYVLDVVFATRNPEEYNLSDLKTCIEYGASPRASIYLIQAAKAHAFIKRRGYVTPEDIKSIGRDVLRHRIIPSFEAEAEELDSDAIIDRLFSEIEVP